MLFVIRHMWGEHIEMLVLKSTTNNTVFPLPTHNLTKVPFTTAVFPVHQHQHKLVLKWSHSSTFRPNALIVVHWCLGLLYTCVHKTNFSSILPPDWTNQTHQKNQFWKSPLTKLSQNHFIVIYRHYQDLCNVWCHQMLCCPLVPSTTIISNGMRVFVCGYLISVVVKPTGL